MMATILATGSSGFLGTILKYEISRLGGNFYDISDFTGEITDIRKSFSLDGKEKKIDIVLHIAGKAHSVPETREEEKAFYDINLEGTQNLCAALDRLSTKPKAFIFISTVSVYGLDKGEDISEDTPLLGTSPYAKSKIQAEQFLQQWAGEGGITLGILRLPLIAGPNPPGNLGAMIRGIKTGRYLSIGDADARKSMVWAEDIAAIIPKLAEIGGIYNLTDGYHPTFGELEREISKALNKSLPRKIPMFIAKIMAKVGDFLGRKAPINSNKLEKIISTLTFDDSKARKELGWQPSSVLDKVSNII